REILGRGTGRDEGSRPRAEDGRAPGPARGQGGRGKRGAREDRRAAEIGSRPGRAAPCGHQSQRASPLAETLVRNARVCQGRQCRLPLPNRAEVQDEVRDARLQRQGEPRRRHHVARRLRSDGVDSRRRGKNRRAREEGGELRTELDTGPRLKRDGLASILSSKLVEGTGHYLNSGTDLRTGLIELLK